MADSSPIISCARANKFGLLRDIYSSIVIPPAVYEEIVIRGHGKPGYDVVKNALDVWLAILKPVDVAFVDTLKKRFGDGESEAIILAKELNLRLLIDEGKAISEAKKYGIKIRSTLTMLLEAKNRGLIHSVRKELNDLIDSGFRCSDDLYNEILSLANEL